MDQELRAYEKYWDSVSTEKTLMTGKFMEGEAKGRAEGREEGLLEGKTDVARKLLNSDVPLSTIIACTGLTEKETLDINIIY